MALALELADTQAERQPPQQTLRRPWQNRDIRAQQGSGLSHPSTQPSQGSGMNQTTGRSTEQPRAPLIRVSQAEKAERARLGLCYYCPEKWVTGHVCKQRLLCYADDGDDFDEEVVQTAEEVLVESDVSHVHAMNGSHRSRPLKNMGLIQGRDVSILIDTGRDRDFLHPCVAETLHLPLSPIRPFKVIVGNGETLLCTHISRQTKLDVQGTIFVVDLHILPVHGPDVVLGMDWLESLGKVTADFAGKTLKFTRGDKTIVINGILPPPRRISLHSLASLTPSRLATDVFELLLLEPKSTSTAATAPEEFPVGLPPAVASVFDRFRAVFHLPEGLPPKRPFDHRVHLHPDAKPVNVRPYRYPYFQKNEIERQIKDMLEQGIIQRSCNPFSSPVLLIRKKDGTFRFCINYRALNNATIPDHFPIPTADELFDELGKARVFTKLDLRSGYH